MTAKTIRNVHSTLSGAFATAKRWEWISWNPAESAKPPTVTRRPVPATAPEDVAKVIVEGRKTHPAMALYLWLVAITGARRGELCALQVCDVDLANGVLHLAHNYVVVGGRRVRKDTKTHQDRYLAIDPVTCAMIREHLEAIRAELGGLGLELPKDAYVFSNDPMGASPWNPDWTTHKASDLAAAADVKLNIKGLRHYTASQLLAARFDLRNTAARLGHGSGGATTLRHYADPVTEVDRRAAAYLAQLTAGSVTEELARIAAWPGHRGRCTDRPVLAGLRRSRLLPRSRPRLWRRLPASGPRRVGDRGAPRPGGVDGDISRSGQRQGAEHSGALAP
jgi:integrase